ncbi:hypothetical protein FNU76_00450 [Chitinimonas arctica]|uniref:Uncharacterized protein n=1 Tax=Chitinimonas arctica TaxID=2594795 RepID=A0A516S9X0_9NEIS|nr:hypothetical protein [Chitinimonas arctica]QDQ24936.1 hypothetical protein FNU76_00450 [Chitinimonas arctica]
MKNQKLDESEKKVLEHLVQLGYAEADIIHEPDGNTTPDFLINGEIAIEVRRLSQIDLKLKKGLEELTIPRVQSIEKILAKLGCPVKGESWFVHLNFTGRIKSMKTLRPKIKSVLEIFSKNPIRKNECIYLKEGLELEVLRSSEVHETMFIVGGYDCIRSGGWLLADMEAYIRYCVDEKSKKTAHVRNKYPHWWLALVDHVGYTLDDASRTTLKKQTIPREGFEKIILINPLDSTKGFEI